MKTLVKKQYIVPFILITSLFFLWGFARAFMDVLNKHFQDTMDMSKAESSLIQVMVYSAYFLIAIPAGLYINKKGYRNGVIIGLLLFGIGSLLFIPSEHMMSFASFLLSLFILGCGLVFLETAANPYVALLGDPSTSASRLNLAQSFNGLGCLLAPIIGGALLFGDKGGNIAIPYSVMGILVIIVALIFTRVKLPEIITEDTSTDSPSDGKVFGLWKRNRFTFGIIALFFYEIAEISINSFFINYATDDGWMDAAQAAKVLSLGGLLLFLVGRVIGSVVMSHIKAELVLTVCAVMTVIGSLIVALNVGIASKSALFVCYAFESIMFPTIFAMSLKGLGSYYTKRAASFMMMTPIGGAVGTFLMGYVADLTSMSTAFVVPMIGYTVVLAFAYSALTGKLR